MLSLFTGLPGAAKTLNLIKYVHENKLFEGRPIYYYGIDELNSTNEVTLDNWTELTEEQVHNWYEMKDSPVIVIDEAQKIWRKRGTSATIPYDIQQLETHRHLGIDILMTCQNPMQIDHEVRALVQQHWHFERPANLKQGRKYEFETCVVDPKKDKYQAVQTTRYKVDKKYFGCYKSAEVHTHGARIPKKLYLVIIGLVLCIAFFVYAFKSVVIDRADRGKKPLIEQSVNTIASSTVTRDGYLNQFVHRYKNIPFSKPFYDELVTPRSYPYVKGCQNFKVNNTNNCTCSSMQGARVEIPEDHCLAFIKYGQHDFTVPDSELQTAMTRYLPTGEPCCGSSGSSEDTDQQDNQ